MALLSGELVAEVGSTFLCWFASCVLCFFRFCKPFCFFAFLGFPLFSTHQAKKILFCWVPNSSQVNWCLSTVGARFGRAPGWPTPSWAEQRAPRPEMGLGVPMEEASRLIGVCALACSVGGFCFTWLFFAAVPLGC